MCSHDSWTNQQTLTGWLANVCSAIFKQQSHSNWSPWETMTFTYTTYTTESDADWSRDHNDRRSTTGYFFVLGFSGGAVSCETKNQQTVTLSSCEVKLGISVWQQLCKRQPSCDPSSTRWAISRCKQHAFVKTTNDASNWRTTPLCTSDQSIFKQGIILCVKRSTTILLN